LENSEGDDDTILESVEGEELVDMCTSVIVPKGANLEGRPREAVKDCVDRYPKDCGEVALNSRGTRSKSLIVQKGHSEASYQIIVF
jgi:hypothetical protein